MQLTLFYNISLMHFNDSFCLSTAWKETDFMQISLFSLSALFQMKTEKERGGEEMVEKQCTACRRTEKMEADIVFNAGK